MSARRISENQSLEQSFTIQSGQAHLSLTEDNVVIHKSGIEFRSPAPFSLWTEMTVTLEATEGGKVNCSGVVISCTGNKHAGFHVSMVFTGMSKQAQTRLSMMAVV